jgi:hypothetical protein
MANLYPSFNFFINGQLVNPPKDWLDLEVLATFENGSPEANLTTSEITFVNAEAKMIRDWIDAGMTGGVGIFEGIPFRVQLLNSTSTFDTFEGFLDLSDDYTQENPVEVKCKIKKIAGIVSFSEKTEGLTFHYLETIGVFSQSDYVQCKYVLEKEFEFIEIAMLSLTTFMLTRELADTIRRLSDDVAKVIALTTCVPAGPVAAVVYAIAITIINLIYAALLIIYIIQMIKELISYLFNPTRIHKGITLRTALSKVCNYLGYQFQSSIADMDVVYLPSKSKPGVIDISQFNPPLAQFIGAHGSGLPNSADFGYKVDEMFIIAHTCFDAKTTIRKINGQDTVCVEPINNTAFWIPTSGFTMVDVLDEKKKYNTDELKENRLISFELDKNDYWTLNNFRGNSYEITTDAVTVNNVKLKTIRGFDAIRIPCALHTRKNGLTEFEQKLNVICQIADSIIGFFGGNSSLSAYITSRVGMMKVSSDAIQVPKLIKYVNGTIPSNYRDIWSAKYLWLTYHNRKSFVQNNWGNQYRNFDERSIPFGFTGFLSLLNYGSCLHSLGGVAEIKQFKWVMSHDRAVVDYKMKEIYTKNLQEIFREEADNAEGSI